MSVTLRGVTWSTWWAWAATGAFAGVCLLTVFSTSVLVLGLVVVVIAGMAWRFPPTREVWGFVAGVSALPSFLALQSPSCLVEGAGFAECPDSGPWWLLLPAAGLVVLGLVLTAVRAEKSIKVHDLVEE